MPSTTVHIPERLLSRIDEVAQDRSISRNRFILQACERVLSEARPSWPPGFFDHRSGEEDEELLKTAVREMELAIRKARKSRKGARE